MSSIWSFLVRGFYWNFPFSDPPRPRVDKQIEFQPTSIQLSWKSFDSNQWKVLWYHIEVPDLKVDRFTNETSMVLTGVRPNQNVTIILKGCVTQSTENCSLPRQFYRSTAAGSEYPEWSHPSFYIIPSWNMTKQHSSMNVGTLSHDTTIGNPKHNLSDPSSKNISVQMAFYVAYGQSGPQSDLFDVSMCFRQNWGPFRLACWAECSRCCYGSCYWSGSVRATEEHQSAQDIQWLPQLQKTARAFLCWRGHRIDHKWAIYRSIDIS